MISTETYAQLREALEPIYDSLPGSKQYPAWKLPNCVQWSNLALPIARSILGQDLVIVAYDHDYPREQQDDYGLPGGYHKYLADLSLPDPLVICGTYLQYTYSQYTCDEHVLICSASQIPAELEKTHVNRGTWPYFRPDLYLGKTILTSEA